MGIYKQRKYAYVQVAMTIEKKHAKRQAHCRITPPTAYVLHGIGGEYMVSRDNRSTRRTKALICDSMLSLMEEKPYQAITVQEVADRAGICRTTFYTHYHDIFDLMHALEEECISSVMQECRKLIGKPYVEGEHPIVTEMYRIGLQHGDRILTLSGPNGDLSFIPRLEEELKQISLAITADYPWASPLNREIYISYVVCGAVGVLMDVLKKHESVTPEWLGYRMGEAITIVQKALLPG